MLAGAISPITFEAVRRMDALFEIESLINGRSAEHRRAVCQGLSAPLVADLETWMRKQHTKLSRSISLAHKVDDKPRRRTSP